MILIYATGGQDARHAKTHEPELTRGLVATRGLVD